MTMWVAGAAAVISVAGSMYASNQGAKSSAKAGGAASKAENEAVIRSNTQSTVRNSYKAGMMNMQLGLRKKQNIQQGFDIGVQAQSVLGATSANAAASGTVGSSVDAITNDIQMKWGEAQAQQAENYESELTNFNNEMEALSISAENEVQTSRKYEYNGPSAGAMWTGALLQGASTFYGVYGAKSQSLSVPKQTNVR